MKTQRSRVNILTLYRKTICPSHSIRPIIVYYAHIRKPRTQDRFYIKCLEYEPVTGVNGVVRFGSVKKKTVRPDLNMVFGGYWPGA